MQTVNKKSRTVAPRPTSGHHFIRFCVSRSVGIDVILNIVMTSTNMKIDEASTTFDAKSTCNSMHLRTAPSDGRRCT